MENTLLFNRIALLPAELQQQVVDFVDFLLLRYRTTTETDELTTEQKQELLRLWEEYDRNPEDALTVEMFEAQTKARYGL